MSLARTTQPISANASTTSCPESFASWYCLNGATCFRLTVEDSILYNCWCRNGFHGARCDYKYTTTSQPEESQPGHQRQGPVSPSAGSSLERSRTGQETFVAALGLSNSASGASHDKSLAAWRHHHNRLELNSQLDNGALINFAYYLSCAVLVVASVVLVYKLLTATIPHQFRPAASWPSILASCFLEDKQSTSPQQEPGADADGGFHQHERLEARIEDYANHAYQAARSAKRVTFKGLPVGSLDQVHRSKSLGVVCRHAKDHHHHHHQTTETIPQHLWTLNNQQQLGSNPLPCPVAVHYHACDTMAVCEAAMNQGLAVQHDHLRAGQPRQYRQSLVVQTALFKRADDMRATDADQVDQIWNARRDHISLPSHIADGGAPFGSLIETSREQAQLQRIL